MLSFEVPTPEGSGDSGPEVDMRARKIGKLVTIAEFTGDCQRISRS